MSEKIKAIIIGIIVIVFIACGGWWYFTHTGSGLRIATNFRSNMNNGIERKITVYNADGKVIMSMTGKFDIQHSDRSLQYIDQHHMKHNIYFGDNTTVTVNEIK